MKFLDYFDYAQDFFDTKASLFSIITSFVSLYVLGDNIIASWLATNNFTASHYTIGAIAQFVFICLLHFKNMENGVVYKSNLPWHTRAIWNLLKINAGGFLALFFTNFLTEKVFTIFIGYSAVMAAVVSILSHWFVLFLEKIMKIKEKELEEKIKS